MAKPTTFKRLPKIDQLKVLRKAINDDQTLLETIQMLTTVDPVIILRKNGQLRLTTNEGLIN